MKKLFLASIIGLGSFTGFSQTKIVHLDVQKVIDTLPSYKAAKKEIQLTMDDAERDLKEIEDGLNKILQELEIATNEGASPMTLDRIRKRAQTQQERYYQAEQMWQRDMQILNARLNEPILKLIQKAIDNVAERMKITYVLDVAATHYAKGEDITNLVITEALALDAAAAAAAANGPK
jgi:outer membrane protein